jgi:hypothetical protein
LHCPLSTPSIKNLEPFLRKTGIINIAPDATECDLARTINQMWLKQLQDLGGLDCTKSPTISAVFSTVKISDIHAGTASAEAYLRENESMVVVICHK